MHIHFIQHEVFEAPGAYLLWALKRGYKVSFSRVYEYEPLPASITSIDLLIVLGGPQSPDTSIDTCPHFNAPAEKALILEAIKEGKAAVGVCLGAQLIGAALGVPHQTSPHKEIGVFPIQLTPAGKQDEKISHFGSPLPVGHWHNDMPGLTKDSRVLALSEGCPRQIISYTNLVYGLQCHMEFTPELVALLVEADKAVLSQHEHYPFVQAPLSILYYDYSQMNEMLFLFLDHLLDAYIQKKNH